MTEVSGPEGTITYQYNEQGNLISVTNVTGEVVSYAYDPYGNKAEMIYPDGRRVSYTYDAMNRMTSVTGLDGEATRYTYDASGRRIGTIGSTLTTEYSYDNVGNLLEQVTGGASEIAFRYSYNRNGYITGEVRTEGGQAIESTYAYDAMGQLTGFRQSTGYGEAYTYDRVGNMTAKVITGIDGTATTLKMTYNAGNQLTAMANGPDRIAYSYDRTGSLVQKTLTSRAYGKLTDRYTYSAQGQLTGYNGYDGYRQQFTYDANGIRLRKSEAGNGNRSTLEELLRGNIAGLSEVVEPAQSQTNANEADVPAGLEWATTEYLYDLTQEYYQVISETTTYTNGTSATTAYAYGLERIAAYTADSKTSYVYDGRGSVAQTVTASAAGGHVISALPDVSVKVQSFAYTAYGEQMGGVKISGFGYNAEAYDAATGMLNLRARLYEPAVGRFGQKDIHPSDPLIPTSINPYLFVYNSPMNLVDSNGLSPVAQSNLFSSIGSTVKKAISTVGQAVKGIATAIVGKTVVNAVVSQAKKAAQSVLNRVSSAWNRTVSVLHSVAQDMKSIDPSRPTCGIEKELIYRKACAALIGDDKTATELAATLENIRRYDKNDWLFLTGDCLFDESFLPKDRFAILNVLKEKQTITAEDLIELGIFTEEPRYVSSFFHHEDVAGEAAVLFELSYRLSRDGTTVLEMTIQDQQARSQQALALVYYMGIQAGLSSVQAYNTAGSAIRMPGASVAAPGYESVQSDFASFNKRDDGRFGYISGQGYSSFEEFKQAQGNAGDGMQWHHIVEQCQIQKSGFASEEINNTANMTTIEIATHRKISGYYSSIQPFTNGLTVRNWLAGQDFESQYNFGIQILELFTK